MTGARERQRKANVEPGNIPAGRLPLSVPSQYPAPKIGYFTRDAAPITRAVPSVACAGWTGRCQQLPATMQLEWLWEPLAPTDGTAVVTQGACVRVPDAQVSEPFAGGISGVLAPTDQIAVGALTALVDPPAADGDELIGE